MHLAGYYQIFIEGLSKLAYPITSLQRKYTNFIWLAKCEESFQGLTQLLTTTPILNIAIFFRDFVVCTDAIKQGLGGILLQDARM